MTIIVILMAALVLACILILFVRSRRNNKINKMINKITLRYLKAMGYKHAQRKDGSTFNIEEQIEKDLQKEE